MRRAVRLQAEGDCAGHASRQWQLGGLDKLPSGWCLAQPAVKLRVYHILCLQPGLSHLVYGLTCPQYTSCVWQQSS